MSCFLRAHGEEFDVASFFSKSPLRPDRVYRKGDPLPAGRAPSSRAGFNLTVSPKGFDDLDGQIRDAIEFLDRHEEELRRLAGFPGVEGVSLDFGRRGAAGQTDTFPSDLLWRAGALDVSLEVTHYAISDPEDSGRPGT